MRTLILCILIVGLCSCKKRKRIDIEGTVIDVYTGQTVPNVQVRLNSIIESSGSIATNEKVYYTMADANGRYKFIDAYFSEPAFEGRIMVDDMNSFITEIPGTVVAGDAKGQSKLVRDLTVRCNSLLTLNIKFDPFSTAQTVVIFPKFQGSRSVAGHDDFRGAFISSKLNPSSHKLGGNIVGYTDGKTIFKVEFLDSQGKLIKTKFDTLVSAGCGTLNEFIFNID